MSDEKSNQVIVEELRSCNSCTYFEVDYNCVKHRGQGHYRCFNKYLSHIVRRNTVHLVSILAKKDWPLILESQDSSHNG